ncbi:MAG: NosD domain-containing protein [Candidatus Lokiarchaeia archaeon]
MGSIKKGKKIIKILFFVAILFTATTAMVVSIHNQNTYPLINLYIMGVSQGSSRVIHEKTLYISSDYNFTGNIYEKIVVTADNIVIDGKGYTLQGPGSGCGFNLTGRNNVTIKNVIVTGWQYGFYLYSSSNNTLSGNTGKNNRHASHGGYNGFYLNSSSNNNTLSDNTANNNGWGFHLVSSSNNTLSNNTATTNLYSGFHLEYSSNYNKLSGNTANNNGWGGFHLYRNSNHNILTGNNATYNGMAGFELWSSSYNTVTDNTVVDLLGRGFYHDSSSINNIIENNTIILTGLSLLGSLFYNSYISFYFYQQNIPSVSNFLIAGLSVTLVTVVLVYSVVAYRRRKGVDAEKEVWELPRDAFLAGTVGGIIGAITAVTGVIWVLKVNTFLTEINIYLGQLSYYLNMLVPWMGLHYLYHGEPLLLYFYPSASLFVKLSFLMSISLIVTSILIGIGFYGTYKAGGGAMGIVGLIFSILGITSGALLIILGTLTTGYMYAAYQEGMTSESFLPVPTPNFLIIWIGFMILGLTFIILGSASISVRYMTEKPATSFAAGNLSILSALFFIIGGFIYPTILIISFGLIFVAFILWVVVFFSSRVL